MISGITAQGAMGASGPPSGDPAALSPSWTKSGLTLSNGDLTVLCSGSSYSNTASKAGKLTGKWYFEVTVDAIGTSGLGGLQLGVTEPNRSLAAAALTAGSVGYAPDGKEYVGAAAGATSGIGTYTTGDVIGVAVDADARTVQARKNGGTFSTAVTISGSDAIMPWARLNWVGAQVSFNFGGAAFADSPPSGFFGWTENDPADIVGSVWRITSGLFGGEANGWTIAEAYMRLTSGGSNVIGSGTPSANDYFPGSPPNLAVDGNSSTFWSSNGANGWWQYDFGADTAVVELAYQNRGDGYSQYLTELTITTSKDGAAFMPVDKREGLTWTSGETKTFTFPA